MTASTDYRGILGLTSDATLTKILLIQTTPVTHPRGRYGERRLRPGQAPQRSLTRHHSVCPPLWRITGIR